MRLRQRDLKTYVLKKRVPLQDPDGTTYEGYEEVGTIIKANIQPAGGKIAAEIYGERLKYMLTMYCENNVDIKEADGICVNVEATEEPDYKVVAVKQYNTHKVVDLEKVNK